MKMTAMPSWVAALLRLGLGLIFIYAGVVKLLRPDEFAAGIASFQLVPVEWIEPLANSLPFFETLAGFWLVMGWRRRIPALALLLLSVTFVIAITQAWTRGLTVSCDCFGEAASPTHSLALLLARDLVLVATAWIVYRQSQRV